jgi:ABC-type nitrate/sulfonate/bicarbonate transport system substrate-binding protein
MTRDEWRKYICCVLTVREELIRENRPMVQDLVNYVLGAGVWLDLQQGNRDKAVKIAAGRKFFNQDPNIIRFVMENPTDRVTYGDLTMVRAEFEELMQLSLDAGHPQAPRVLRESTSTTASRRPRSPPPSSYEDRGPALARAPGRRGLTRRTASSRPASSSRLARRPTSP